MSDLAAFKARLPIVEIVRRRVRLHRAGPDWKGLCPFHQEKTPSFTVSERRGTFHCFGCGAHGNALDFLMELDGLEFRAAVERAAELTGLEPPVRTRPDPERAKVLALSEVLELAATLWRDRLQGTEGAAARAYLQRRGLSADAVARFELGLATGGRSRLTEALRARDVSLDDLVEGGLVVVPEDGGQPYDRFRDRIVFPIRDARGRLVGFGGRALAADARAKYLNSPEGPLFRKRELLYGAEKLDRRAGRGRLHVVEGYMDVIALAEMGVTAVAPLGTAVTAEQVQALWRLDDRPLICLDGDEAGHRAAGRLAELAAEQLRPGLSLDFALLPPGDDPDSLVRRGGPPALAAATANPLSLFDMLWRHVGGDRQGEAPEMRALVQRRLREIVERIVDGDVRREYRRELDARTGGRRGGWRRANPPAASGLAADGLDPERLAALRLLAPLLRHPHLLQTFEEPLDRVAFGIADLDRFRQALLNHLATAEGLDLAGFSHHVDSLGLGEVRREIETRPAQTFEVGSTREELTEAYALQLERYRQHCDLGLERDFAARTVGEADGSGDWRGLDSLLNARAGRRDVD
ncbi:MAG: DNA primase [Pseudomonadota bacterium]